MSLFTWPSLREAPPPMAAVELAADHVSAITLEIRSGSMAVTAHATEPLPDHALVPSLTGANIQNRAAVSSAVNRALERVGRPKRVGLVLPDPIAKVSLVRFEQVPAKRQDLEQLIRWQVRKSAPFPMEEAQVSYVRGIHASDGQEFVVTIARRDVVAEYEELLDAFGAHAGIVDLATFNVTNAVLAGSAPPPGDWLLVNVASAYVSLAVLRGPHLIFFRSRAADADDALGDLVHQTTMYYEDRLQGTGFTRVLLAGASTVGAQRSVDIDWIRRNLEERLTTSVETVDPRAAVTLTDRITAAPALLDTLTPLVGMLLRGRELAHQ